MDSGQFFGDAVPPCDPYEPDDCAAGQKCDVVVRRNPTAEQFDIYTGCVEVRTSRGEGDPCVPFNDFATPYEALGLFDEVHVDPCEQGLFCAADPVVRGLSTCQASCQSGGFQGFPSFGCGGEGQYCTGPDPFREICRDSDGCDPTDPAACGPGRSCYLRTDDNTNGILSLCLAVPEEPVDDGDGCQFFNDCNVGSVCWGPVRVPPSAWTNSNVQCRTVCDPDTDDDAGADGTCGGDAECVPFSESGLAVTAIDGVFGQCEE